MGRRNSLSGSLSGSGFPNATASATYDVANELTNWNGSSISYDSNGNTVSDNVHSYGWDSRNHLSAIDSGNTASFVYDPFGRRVSKTVLGTTTSFLYDFANPVQELSGTTPTANLLAGSLDEYFTRTDSNGVRNFLTDALGSSLALSDGSDNTQTQYVFDPFGNTTVLGGLSANSFQYTGRENDGISLYFYRSRFYNSQIGRFISEDPLRVGSGSTSLYSYAADNPVSLRDPTGQNPFCVVGAIAGTMVFNWNVILQSVKGRKTSYYSGWDGLGRIAAGNAQYAMIGCMAGYGAGAAAATAGAGATATAAVAATTAGASYVFYSGENAADAALQWALANNGVTIQMTEYGEAAANGAMSWEEASEAFANSASGTVQVFSNSPFENFGNIWYTTELPALANNPNVTNVVFNPVP